MRITCQSCQAHYTVADEKIGKKVFQLRCKKCSATIVVDGNAIPRAESATTKAFDYAGGSKEQWTVNVADGDQRTMTAAEIAREYAAGVVDDDTYCWKEGMNDWLPICEIEQLYGVAKNPPAPSGGAPAVAPTDGNADARPREGSEPPPSTTAARRDGGRGRGADLFGNVEKAGSEEEQAARAAPSPVPPPAATTKAEPAEGPKLTGARNENSLLFSLSSLTETAGKGADAGGGGGLAASSSSASTSSSSSASTSSSASSSASSAKAPSPGSSSSEASGLIDIRSLSADMDKDDSGKPKKAGSKESRVDDVMNLSGGGAFGSALAAPVLALPVGESTSSSSLAPGESKPNKTLIPAILGGSALIAAAIVAAVVLSRPPPVQPVAALPTATMSGVGTAPTTSVAATDSTNTNPVTSGGNTPPAPATGEAPAKVGGVVPADRGGRPIVGATGVTGATGAATGTKPDETAPPATAATAATPTAAPTPEKPADFASALASAVGKTGEKPPENAATGGSAAAFDRGAAASALGGIDVQGCAKPDGPTGAGHVTVTFAPDGNVASAVVDSGPFPGTPVGGCIAGKFRGAHVPAFSGGAIKVGKSFTIN
jgi:predicted Zn finger-like uncharacterized protein